MNDIFSGYRRDNQSGYQILWFTKSVESETSEVQEHTEDEYGTKILDSALTLQPASPVSPMIWQVSV